MSSAPPSLGVDLAWHALLPLSLGGAIYLVWRAPTLVVFGWARRLGVLTSLAALRAHVATTLPLPPWVRLNLPDALWVYALTFYLGRLWLEAPRRQRVGWTAIGPVVGIGAELGQLIGIVPGTFDARDLVFCIGASGAALVTLQHFGRRPS